MRIFIITLPDQEKRRNFVERQFYGRSITGEFVAGVIGTELDGEGKKAAYDLQKARYFNRELTPGEIGCSLSHRLIYEQMLQNSIERAIVLEDDVTLDEDFFSIIPFFETLPIRNYIIKLDHCSWIQKDRDNYRYGHFTPWHRIKITGDYFIGQPVHDPQLTWGYYLDIRAARIMFSLLPRVFLPADAWWYFRKHVRLRMLNRAVIHNNDDIFESIIGGRERPGNGPAKNNIPALLIRKVKKGISLMTGIFH